MLEEIAGNIDIFLFVLFLILVMFSMLYHLLLAENDADDGWDSYGTAIWRGA